jgi:hypothetical protein
MFHVVIKEAIGPAIIRSIQIVPALVGVGKNFGLAVTVTNDGLGVPITYVGGCASPLCVVFSNNVMLKHTAACGAITSNQLGPKQNATVSGPGSGVTYNAVSAGPAKATVTFSYKWGSLTYDVSKSIGFNIHLPGPPRPDGVLGPPSCPPGQVCSP